MDLKGSLVDTNLKIYPSQKLKTFLENENFDKALPVNIGKLAKGEAYKSDSLKENKENSKPSIVYLNKEDIEHLIRIKKKLNCDDIIENEIGKLAIDESEKTESQADEVKKIEKNDVIQKDKLDECKKEMSGFLTTSDIDWLYDYIQERKSKDVTYSIPYLHELLEGSNIEFPENATIKRNPVLEARCVKLRAQQEAREYRQMTKGVDNVRMRFPEDSISYQLKQMNRQLIAIGQFIISIFAGFLFGFRGIEWMVGNLDFGFRLLLGVMCALIIALAEIYFLAKKLNEELSVPETTQLGGPPTFVDERFDGNKVSKPIEKPHQD